MKICGAAFSLAVILSSCSEPLSYRVEQCKNRIPAEESAAVVLETEEIQLKGTHTSPDLPTRMTHMVKIHYGAAGTPPGPMRKIQLCYFNGNIDLDNPTNAAIAEEAADAVQDTNEFENERRIEIEEMAEN